MTMTAEHSERAANGALKLWVHHESSRVIFRQCADIIVEQFGAEGRDRLDGGDQLFWDYMASELPFTLHLERGVGISVIAGELTPACETLVRRIAEVLASRVAA